MAAHAWTHGASNTEYSVAHATPATQRAPAPRNLGCGTASNDGHLLSFRGSGPCGLPEWFPGCAASYVPVFSPRSSGRGRCIFGCVHSPDAVDHYMIDYMSSLQFHPHDGRARLRLPVAATPEDRGVDFLLLSRAEALPDEVLTRRALLLAAAYRLHCTRRHGPPLDRGEALRQAFDQAVREAARGHDMAIRHLDTVWVSSRRPRSTTL